MSRGTSTAAWITTSTIVLGILGFITWWMGAQLFHGTVRFLWGNLSGLVPLVALTVLFFVMVYFFEVGEEVKGGITAILTVVAFLGLVAMLFIAPYQRNLAYYESVEIEEVEATDISFRERAPYDVAKVIATKNLGDANGDATGVVKSLPASGEHGAYSTSVVRRGWIQGYESSHMIEAPLFGQVSASRDVQRCSWSEDASLRFGGWAPGNNLKRAIYWNTGGHVKVEQKDAVVVCEDSDTPVLYAPLTKLQGFFFPIEVPAGVAIYNGNTGELAIEESYDGDVPVYSSDIATKQRNSTRAMGEYGDYFYKRVGWENTSVDSNDPNGGNRSNFHLASEDGEATYKVTPLTPRGDSPMITAIGTVEANTVESGTLNPFVVQQYGDDEYRQPNSAIAQYIRADILEGYKAQELTVFEVVPSRDGTWTATVGQSQTINYRAIIDTEGVATLYNARGEVVGGGKVGEEPDMVQEDAPDEVAQDESGEDEAPVAEIDLGKPLDEMSTDELRDAMDTILDELESRTSE